MHEHIFIPSIKKDIFFCKVCQKLSYKGIICQSLPINPKIKIIIDPFSLRFIPFSCIIKNKSQKHLNYLQNRNIFISKIEHLINTFGFKLMIFYKAINLMDQIYLKNEVEIDKIDIISSICILLSIQFNDCFKIDSNCFNSDDNEIIFNFNQRKDNSNISGFYQYIKNKISNFRYWEVICLKYLNYDLGKFSAYDYLILFFRLGIVFCEKKIDLLNKLENCLRVLYFVNNDCKSCNYSQYIIAMSIIKFCFEFENYFDKNIFRNIYGVDLYKEKYVNCSNIIKIILLDSIYNKNNLYNNYYMLNHINNYNHINKNFFINNKNRNKNSRTNLSINSKNTNEFDDLELNHTYINNSEIFIQNNAISNLVNINNNNILFRKFNNYYYSHSYVNNWNH